MAYRICIIESGVPKLFKRAVIAVIVLSCLFTGIPGGFSIPERRSVEKDEAEIVNVVKGAVEDTAWLHVSSRQEMDRVLNRYYTAPLCRELAETAWNFVSKPTDWDYIIKVENCKITSLSGEQAAVLVDIVEKDDLADSCFPGRFEYTLIKMADGWRINKICPSPEQ